LDHSDGGVGREVLVLGGVFLDGAEGRGLEGRDVDLRVRRRRQCELCDEMEGEVERRERFVMSLTLKVGRGEKRETHLLVLMVGTTGGVLSVVVTTSDLDTLADVLRPSKSNLSAVLFDKGESDEPHLDSPSWRLLRHASCTRYLYGEEVHGDQEGEGSGLSAPPKPLHFHQFAVFDDHYDRREERERAERRTRELVVLSLGLGVVRTGHGVEFELER
jgi:hypothetical protein